MDDSTRAHQLCEDALVLDRSGDVDGAVVLWTQASKLGSTRAMRNIGLVHRKRGDLESALLWLRQAAAGGNAEAWNPIGVILSQERGDQTGAEEAWRAGAEAGQADCAFNLGFSLNARGDGLGAVGWFRKAAELGSASGMNALAVLLNSAGDVNEAKQWYLRAANAGSHHAMQNLGELSQQAGDYEVARQWYERAVAAGSPTAGGLLEALDSARPPSSPRRRIPRQGSGGALITWGDITGSAHSSHAEPSR